LKPKIWTFEWRKIIKKLKSEVECYLRKSELPSDSTDLNDQKLKWKSSFYWVFSDQNGVHNFIKTENMDYWVVEIIIELKSEVECYRLNRFEWSKTQIKRAQFTEWDQNGVHNLIRTRDVKKQTYGNMLSKKSPWEMCREKSRLSLTWVRSELSEFQCNYDWSWFCQNLARIGSRVILKF